MTNFYRNEDPNTSRLAAESLDLDFKEVHYFILKHHNTHQDSDSNAGLVAFEKGLVRSPETGRRASRTLREAHKMTEFRIDPSTKSAAVVTGRISGRLGQRNYLTEDGKTVLAILTALKCGQG